MVHWKSVWCVSEASMKTSHLWGSGFNVAAVSLSCSLWNTETLIRPFSPFLLIPNETDDVPTFQRSCSDKESELLSWCGRAPWRCGSSKRCRSPLQNMFHCKNEKSNKPMSVVMLFSFTWIRWECTHGSDLHSADLFSAPVLLLYGLLRSMKPFIPEILMLREDQGF